MCRRANLDPTNFFFWKTGRQPSITLKTAQKFLDAIESKRGRAAAFAVLLSGCVAPSQPVLDYVGQHCADGYRSACDALPYWRSVVAAEHWQQAEDVLIGVLSVGVLAVDALAISKGHAPSPPPAP